MHQTIVGVARAHHTADLLPYVMSEYGGGKAKTIRFTCNGYRRLYDLSPSVRYCTGATIRGWPHFGESPGWAKRLEFSQLPRAAGFLTAQGGGGKFPALTQGSRENLSPRCEQTAVL
jgi:hypothetical protein